MRRTVGLAVAAAAVAFVTPAQADAISPRLAAVRAQLLDHTAPGVLVVAHRACHEVAPENSLLSLEHCRDLGVELVEADVRTTVDGVLVMFHDSEVSRMTDGWGYVAEMTFENVSALRLRERDGGPGAHLTAARVPTLEAFLRAAKDHLIVHLDVKAADMDAVRAVVAEAGAEAAVLYKVNAEPGAPVWAETFEHTPEASLIRSRIRDDGRSLGDRIAGHNDPRVSTHTIMFSDPDFLAGGAPVAAEQGQRLWVATQLPAYAGGYSDALSLHDPDAGWGQLIAAGVTIIETDRPSWLVRYLEETGRR